MSLKPRFRVRLLLMLLPIAVACICVPQVVPAQNAGSVNVPARIHFSSRADVDTEADARTLSREQRFEKEKSELRRLSLQFAKHAAEAVDAP